MGDVTAVSSTSSRAVPEASAFKYPAGLIGEHLAMRDELKKLGDRRQKINLRMLRMEKDEIDHLAKEKLEVVKKITDANKSHEKWSYAGLLSSYAHSCCSIVGGAYLYYGLGQEAGKKVALAGALSLANTFMNHSQSWKALADLLPQGHENFDTLIRTVLPFAIPTLSFLTGINQLWHLPNDLKDTVQIVHKFSQMMTAGIQVGDFYTLRKKTQAEVQLLDVESKTTFATHRVENLARRGESIAQTSDEIAKVWKKGFTNHKNATNAAASG